MLLARTQVYLSKTKLRIYKGVSSLIYSKHTVVMPWWCHENSGVNWCNDDIMWEEVWVKVECLWEYEKEMSHNVRKQERGIGELWEVKVIGENCNKGHREERHRIHQTWEGKENREAWVKHWSGTKMDLTFSKSRELSISNSKKSTPTLTKVMLSKPNYLFKPLCTLFILASNKIFLPFHLHRSIAWTFG